MEDQNTVREILEMMKTREFTDYKDFKKVDSRRLKNITGNVNRLLRYIEVRDIMEINYLIRAGTTYVAKALGLKSKKKVRTEPWWKRRIQGDIKILRRDVNILERKARGQLKNERKYKELDRRYKIARKGLDVVLEELKQRLTAKTAKIKKYDQRIAQYRQNRMFRTDQKKFYQELNGDFWQKGLITDAEESKKFWGDTWNVEKEHKADAEWFTDIKNERKPVLQNPVVITE